MRAKAYLLGLSTNALRLLDGIVEVESEIKRRRRTSSKSRLRISQRKVGSAAPVAGPAGRQSGLLDASADPLGSVDGLPPDLSLRKKRYLKTTGYGRKRAR